MSKDVIDRKTLLKTYKNWLLQLEGEEDKGDRRGVETCIAVLEDAPAIDAVSVVRCKDCKYYSRKYCTVESILDYTHIEREPNDFCSFGERKDDE